MKMTEAEIFLWGIWCTHVTYQYLSDSQKNLLANCALISILLVRMIYKYYFKNPMEVSKD